MDWLSKRLNLLTNILEKKNKMPVQINEMIIRANIVEHSHSKKEMANAMPKSNIDKDEIIKECTEIIMEIINRKSER
jgi:hypothetical protein